MTSLPPPIHRIPIELLSEIMSQVAPLRYTRISERYSIISLSHVCKHWRYAALSTRSLWTFILFRPRLEEVLEDMPRELDCARAWLSRSGQCTLEIRTSSTLQLNEWAFTAAFELLVPHCLRWKIIRIRNVDFDIYSHITGKMPSLERADIGIVKSHTSINLFTVAPRVRRLRFTIRSSQPLQVDLVTFPWIQLTHLDIQMPTSSALHHILVSAPNLSFLKVILHKIILSQFETITNSNISTLHLSGRGNDSENQIEYMLDRLVLPALFDLKLSNYGRDFTSFISRSACSLTSLHINMSTESDFIELIQILPTLQELSVILGHILEWDAMVECFTVQQDLHLAPNLRSLTIRWSYRLRTPTTFSLNGFADMVDSRWEPKGTVINATSIRSPLNHVKVHHCVLRLIHEPSSALVRLRRFSEEGLDVTLLTDDKPPRDLLWNPPHTI